MPRVDSVYTPPPPPLRHPYFEDLRAQQRREFEEEIAHELDRWAPMQARVAAARILETGWPS